MIFLYIERILSGRRGIDNGAKSFILQVEFSLALDNILFGIMNLSKSSSGLSPALAGGFTRRGVFYFPVKYIDFLIIIVWPVIICLSDALYPNSAAPA